MPAPPKLSIATVRAIRREVEDAKTARRRPRLKKFYTGTGHCSRSVYDAANRRTFRWVE